MIYNDSNQNRKAKISEKLNLIFDLFELFMNELKMFVSLILFFLTWETWT